MGGSTSCGRLSITLTFERTTQAHSEKYGEAERSGKLLVTEKVLGLWREQGHRCSLFSQTHQMLDILEAAIVRAGTRTGEWTGQPR